MAQEWEYNFYQWSPKIVVNQTKTNPQNRDKGLEPSYKLWLKNKNHKDCEQWPSASIFTVV